MPDMDGSETNAAMRAINPGITVFICSAHITEIAAQNLLKQGIYGLKNKPFVLEDMVAQFEQAVRVIAG